MKLLIVTQAVDVDDPVLGFFHQWIAHLAPAYERVSVICLREGLHSLPPHVVVYSLGKEGGRSRLKYVWRLFRYAWTFRTSYDAVFVHMNQEYVLLAGPLWRLLGKRVYLWRNFHTGNWGTYIAALLCNAVFYTSRSSYTAHFGHAHQMPVGVDTELFTAPRAPARIPRSILSVGRIAPVKLLDVLIDALGILASRGEQFTAHLYGDALPGDAAYYSALKAQVAERGLTNQVTFRPGVPNRETPDLYRTHEVFVNVSPSGMYDKTIIESSACECIAIASSQDFRDATGDQPLAFDGSATALAGRLSELLALPEAEKAVVRRTLRSLAERHSLAHLVKRLVEVIQ